MTEFWVHFFLVAEGTMLGFFFFIAIFELFNYFLKLEKADWAFPMFTFAVLLAAYSLMSGETRSLFLGWKQVILERIRFFILSSWLPALVLIFRQTRKHILPFPLPEILIGAGLLFAFSVFLIPNGLIALFNNIRLFFIILTMVLIFIGLIRLWVLNRRNEAVLSIALIVFTLSLILDLLDNLQGHTLLKFKPYGAAFLCVLLLWDRIFQKSEFNSGGNGKEVNNLPKSLTPREREIALFLLQGLSYKEIAAKLFISEKTVNIHVQKIYRKTGVNSRSMLISEFQKPSAV
jgi:DNA-binding CsgD family transcriptional regulator